MGGSCLVSAFLISLAPAILGQLGGSAWRLELPWVPLALLPWIALSGWPRGARPGPSALSLIGLLLPALALALAADLGAGLERAAVLATAAWGTVLCALLAFGAQRGGAAHARLWLVLVPGAALLLAARSFVGDLSGEALLARILEASPLAWSVERAGALRSGADAGTSAPLGPLAVAVLLAAARERGARSGEGSPG